MLLECHRNISNAVGMELESSWNTFPLGMPLERFEHEQNIPTTHKNGPELLESSWNAAESFRIWLEYPGMYKEFSFQLRCIPVHSSSSVIGLLTLKVLVATIDAQWEGMGDVGSARYEFLKIY